MPTPRPDALRALLTAAALALAVAASGLALLAPAPALADEPATVVVAPFSGPSAHGLRRETYRALEDEKQDVVDVEAVATRIESLGLDLARAEDRVALAREFGAHAVVTGSVAQGRKLELVVTVYNGADGTELGTAEFRDKESALKKVVRKGTWPQLRGAVLRGERPAGAVATVAAEAGSNTQEPAPAPERVAREPDATPAPASEDLGASAEVGVRPAVDLVPGNDGVTMPLEIAVGIRGFNRTFEYADDLNRSLRPYTLDFGPSFNVDLAWFPGAHATDGIGQWFGLVGNFHSAFAIDSKTPRGDEAFPTTALGWSAALRTRVPLGLHEISLDLGFGQERFAIDDAPSTERPLIPNVEYSAARFALNGRFGLGGWRNNLSASFGYLLVVDAGEVTSEAFFPHADVHGIVASLGYGFSIIPEVELRASVDWSHYWFKMNPRPDDPIFVQHASVAGGARDDYIGATFAVAYRLFQAP